MKAKKPGAYQTLLGSLTLSGWTCNIPGQQEGKSKRPHSALQDEVTRSVITRWAELIPKFCRMYRQKFWLADIGIGKQQSTLIYPLG